MGVKAFPLSGSLSGRAVNEKEFLHEGNECICVFSAAALVNKVPLVSDVSVINGMPRAFVGVRKGC